MRVLLITGTVGVGKTTVGSALAERLGQAGEIAGFLDLDQLSRLWPAPAGDPFREQLVLANLGATFGNFVDAGATWLVLAWAIDCMDDLDRLSKAIATTAEVVRLAAPDKTVADRLRLRHVGPEAAGLDWHLRRAPELATLVTAATVGAHVIDASQPVHQVVDAILARLR